MPASNQLLQRALILGATLSLVSLPLSAGAQDQSPKRQRETAPAPTEAQASGQEALEPLPEGEPLPDMPDAGAESASRTTTDKLAVAGKQSRAAGLGPNYIIGAEDLLDIDVFSVPELRKAVRVSNDGTIGLALVGRIKAAGLTPDQLRDTLEAKYSETYLQDPQITILVVEFHGQPVSVIGAVEKPSVYQLTGRRTLIEMLSTAGGLAKRSSAPAGRYLFVTRKGGFGDLVPTDGMELIAPDKLQINIQKLLYSQDDSLNIEIQPRDTISVTKAEVVYVLGDVRKPGGFVLEDREQVTVIQVLAMAEGVLNTAAKNRARIIRQSAGGEKTEILVNLDKVLAGKSEDVALAANDILVVPNSAAKSALKRGAEVTLSTISGVMIYRR